jgi:hypothetical protein
MENPVVSRTMGGGQHYHIKVQECHLLSTSTDAAVLTPPQSISRVKVMIFVFRRSKLNLLLRRRFFSGRFSSPGNGGQTLTKPKTDLIMTP